MSSKPKSEFEFSILSMLDASPVRTDATPSSLTDVGGDAAALQLESSVRKRKAQVDASSNDAMSPTERKKHQKRLKRIQVGRGTREDFFNIYGSGVCELVVMRAVVFFFF
jgi:hypothetical protein